MLEPRSPGISPRAIIVVLGIDLALTLVFFWPFLLPGYAFFAIHNQSYSGWRELVPRDRVERLDHVQNPLMTDDLLMFHPEVLLSVDSLKRGVLPTWNPYAFGGYPHIATGIPSFYYPLMALHLVTEPLRAYGIAAALQALLAAFAFSVFLLCVGIGPLAAALGGVVFVYSGWMTAHMLYYQVSGGSAWLGLMFLGVELIVGGRRRSGSAWLALAVGLSFLSGFPQTAFMNVYVAIVYGLVRMLAQPRTSTRLLSIALQLGWPVLLGLLIAAGQLVPSTWLTISGASNRSIPALDVLAQWKLPPAALLTYLSPNLFGHPYIPAQLLALAHIPGQGSFTNYAEMQAYVGVLPVLLVLAGAGARHKALRWFALGLLVLALTAATGTFVLRAMSVLPGVRIGDPKRFLLPASAALAILAALGLDHLVTEGQQRRRRIASLAVFAALLALGCAFWLDLKRDRFAPALAEHVARTFADLSVIDIQKRIPAVDADTAALLSRASGADLLARVSADAFETNRANLLACCLRAGALLAAAGVLLFALGSRWRPHATLGLLLLGSFDLIAQGREGFWTRRLGPGFNRPLPTDDFLRPHPLVDAMRLAGSEPFRVIRFRDEWIFPPKTLQPFGIEDAQGYAALYLRRYQKLIEAIPGTATAGCTAVQALQTEAALGAPGIDLLNVRFVLTRNEISLPSYRLFMQRDGIRVYENLEAWARAFVAPNATVLHGSAEVLSRISLGAIRNDEVLLEQEPKVHPTRSPSDQKDQVFWIARDERSASLSVTSGGGFLVITDTFDASWKAWVDDQPTPIEPAYGAFRAIAISPGTHRVRVQHQASAEWIGLSVSALAGLAWLLVWIVPGRRPCGSAGVLPAASGHGGDGN